MSGKWFDESFDFARITGNRILVLGIGGGCDAIAAYAIARILADGEGRAVVYGNTKSRVEPTLRHVTTHVLCVPPKVLVLDAGTPTHGTTLIEQSLPRGEEGSPLVFLLGRGAGAHDALLAEIMAQSFDCIVAVDIGGDVLVDEVRGREPGRDLVMLRILRRVQTPLFLVVVAPGSDGEVEHGDFVEILEALEGQERFAGTFPLGDMVGVFETYGGPLEANRTAKVIAAAHAGGLLAEKRRGLVRVPRGIRPLVPREWLLHGFVFLQPA